jgi:hypothetical protein
VGRSCYSDAGGMTATGGGYAECEQERHRGVAQVVEAQRARAGCLLWLSRALRVGQDRSMSTPTTADRVLELLRVTRKSLDDDELAGRLQVSPRQTINQVCRKLERDGHIRRLNGPHGKIVNQLVERLMLDVGLTGASVEAVEAKPLPPGNAREQQEAELLMVEALGAQLGLTLRPRTLKIGGSRVEIDAADDELTVLVEAWAHQGAPKPAQKHKVLADALKLIWVASTVQATPTLILCLSDADAARHFTTGRSWAAAALADLGVNVTVVDLPAKTRQAVKAAQERQRR